MAILEQASVLTDAIRPVPAKELEQRLEKFRKLMMRVIRTGRWRSSVTR